MPKLFTGAEIVFKCLEDQDVEYIIGYPGGAVLPIYDELKNFQSIKHILVRHEQGAGHAAEGYARSSGKPCVVLVTSGPGATKMDLRNAYFFTCDGTRGGSKALRNVGKVWGNIKSTFGTTFVTGVWLKMA